MVVGRSWFRESITITRGVITRGVVGRSWFRESITITRGVITRGGG